jgi:hypothetical protein
MLFDWLIIGQIVAGNPASTDVPLVGLTALPAPARRWQPGCPGFM